MLLWRWYVLRAVHETERFVFCLEIVGYCDCEFVPFAVQNGRFKSELISKVDLDKNVVQRGSKQSWFDRKILPGSGSA
jgi:hypothetical protein